MKHRLLLVLILAAGSTASAQVGGPDERSGQVDLLLAELVRADGPGAAVMVIDHGAVVHAKGYGLASVAARTPITPQTAFDLASVSKQFTAMAVMILAEQGELGYDDPLARFFPDLPRYAERVTVRHLLNHTSGLPDYMAIFTRKHGKEKGLMPTSQDVLGLLGGESALVFEPGSRWAYSNSGYVVLALIVEQVSGQRFPEFMKENIFAPLGMKDSLVYDESKPAVKNRAISYSQGPTGYVDIDYHPLNLIYGDGAVNTNLEEMFKWDQALYTEKLVKAATLQFAFTPGRLNDGSRTEYGFGWGVGRFLGLDLVSHGGGWAGFRTFILRFPAQQFSVIVLSNLAQFDPDTVSKRIARIYLHERMKVPASIDLGADVLRAYVGRYELGPGLIVEVTLDRGELWMRITDQPRQRLLASAKDEFFVDGREDMGISFHADGQPEAASLTLHQMTDLHGKRMK